MLRVTTRFTGPPGSPYFNALNFDESLVGGAAFAHDAVVQFWTDLLGQLRSDMSLTVEGEVESVAASTGQTTGVESVTPVTLQGTNAGDPLPMTTQGLIRLRTGTYVNGREIRGRIFIPGLTVGNMENGRLYSGGQTTLTNSAETNLIGSDVVVYSPTHGQQVPATVAATWSEFAVLRSRRD